MTDGFVRYIGGNFSSLDDYEVEPEVFAIDDSAVVQPSGAAKDATREAGEAGAAKSETTLSKSKSSANKPAETDVSAGSQPAGNPVESGASSGTADAPADGAPRLTFLDLVRSYQPTQNPEAANDGDTAAEAAVKPDRVTTALAITGAETPRRARAWMVNAASIVGMVCALGATGWYFAAQSKSPVAHRAPAAPAGALAAKVRAKLAVRKVPARVLYGVADLEYAVAERRHFKVIRVQKGDSFVGVLTRAGVPAHEARSALATLGGIFDPRQIRPGNKISIAFGIMSGDNNRFLGLKFDSSYDRTIQIQRQESGDFAAAQTRKDLSMRLVRGNGTIQTSLFQAGLEAGVPASRMIRIIHLFSFQVDFQRDIKKGDKFEILYRIHKDHTGAVVRHGEVIYAALTLSGTKIRMYRFPANEGEALYLNEKGESNRRALMRTPIDGARLTSGFGYRRHPILGYSKLHTGVDFGAPPGTPIYAAGDGTIEKMGWFGGYGRYVRIRHNREYSTAYAHMSRFVPTLREGKRVRQGQVIGYVGTTGRSTGPHLHYEVLRYNKQINPMNLTLPAFKKLQGVELTQYLRFRDRVDRQFVALKKNGAAGRLIRVKAEATTGECANGRRIDATDKRPCPAPTRAQ